jgi:hypothetical protein
MMQFSPAITVLIAAAAWLAPASNLSSAQKRQPLEQMHLLLVLQ